MSDVEDPRKPSCNFQYSLVTILFISLIGVLCGAKDWEEIVQAAHGMTGWLSQYVDISSGIPSSQTLKRVISLLPNQSLRSLMENLKSSFTDLKEDIVAIDGIWPWMRMVCRSESLLQKVPRTDSTKGK